MIPEDELEYFVGCLRELIDSANLLKSRDYSIRNSLAGQSSSFNYGNITSTDVEYKRVRNEKDELLLEFNELLEGINSSLKINIKPVDVLLGINNILIKARGLLKLLESKISPLKEKDTKKIENYRNRIKELPCTEILKTNLMHSLKEIEQGDFLGGVLTSGRVIAYCISKLLKEAKSEENIIKYLNENNKLPLNKEDKEGIEKKLIKEIIEEHTIEKGYRDLNSHNINHFPQIEEAFRELGNAILLVQKIF
ncbi:MAG: hypothetical protein ABIH28_04195 [archaeon]